MSFRDLAVEVYRAMKEVNELEKKLMDAPYGSSERNELEEKLRVARAELKRLRALLEGAKD